MASPDSGILRALRASSGHVSSAELVEQLHATPQAIAERIAALKAAGYDIEEHPHFGYRFVAAPDRLIADDLTGMVEGCGLAERIVVFEKTGSTNDLAAGMGRDGVREGIVIFAEEQTAGRGRLGRRWESDPRQGLWFSLLLRPRFSPAYWTRLTTWAAVAIAEAIENETGCKTAIKWPNDIYIDGKKVAGILIEGHFDKAQEGFAVLGIGINVNQDRFPEELAGKACSLKMATGHYLDRQKIAAAILRKLDALYTRLETDFEEIVASANRRGFLHGKRIQITEHEHLKEGIAERLDEQGGLVLRLDDGTVTTIHSGEVFLKIQ